MVTNAFKSFVEFRKEDIHQSIPSRFAKQVSQFPNHIAVRTKTEQTTYDTLDRFSNRIAHAILSKCDTKEMPVALLFDPGVPMVAAILGVLKAGGFFLPLDPASPAARNTTILDSALASCVLADAKNYTAALNLCRDSSLVINVDDLEPHFQDAPLGGLAIAESLACVLYTSGSTGRPKGVLHNHCNFLHSIREHTNSLRLNSEDRISFLSSYGHIAGITSILRALLNGATLNVFNLRAEGWGELPRWMIAEGITIYQSVPTLFRQWAQALNDTHLFPKLRVIHLGGEPVTINDVALYKKHTSTDCVLVHNLGSTEVPTFRQYFINKETPFTNNLVPVGYPVEEKEVILVDESGGDAGFNEIGEIVVKSRYFALGYWQNAELTQEAFLPDPSDNDNRMFHTGDLGRMRPDGCLEHLGRKDRQIKIRGIRIEPAEIEAMLGQQPSVRQAVVSAKNDSNGEKQLVAYIIAASNNKPSSTTLREYLRECLPAHMVPTAFVTLDQFPLTASGKVDHLALPEPESNIRQSEVPFIAPVTSIEKIIARIWEEVLGIPGVGLQDRFLDLGGNSLKAMQVVTRLQDAIEYVLPLQPLFNIATVALQAATVEEHLKALTNGDDESQLLAELEAMSEEEAQQQLVATKRKTSHWQTEGVSKAYLDVRSAIPGSDLEIEVMLKLIRMWFPVPRNILDLGCGDGFLGRTLLEHFPDCHVSFVDFSEPMLDAARDKLTGSRRATIIKADFTTAEWVKHLGDSHTFDLVLSGLSIHHQTDVRKKQLYAEIYHLLSIGGVFLNLEQVASATDEIAKVYCEYLIDHLHSFQCRTNPDKSREEIAEGFYASPARKENILALVETQCVWLRDIGFQDVDCFFKAFEHALFGGRKTAPVP